MPKRTISFSFAGAQARMELLQARCRTDRRVTRALSFKRRLTSVPRLPYEPELAPVFTRLNILAECSIFRNSSSNVITSMFVKVDR